MVRQTRQDRGIGITTVPLVGGLRALTGGNRLFRKRKGHTVVQASEVTGGVLLYEPRPIHEPRRTPLEGPLGGTSNAVEWTSREGITLTRFSRWIKLSAGGSNSERRC